jgi:hypothetical protein
MAVENRTPTKNRKTQTIRKMLDHEGPRITLLWVPSHVGIPGNEKTDQAAKEALDEDISTTERYPIWRNGWPKSISKRETKDGKTETTTWKKGSRKSTERRIQRNAKKRANGNIQTQNRVYKGHTRPQDRRGPFCNTYLSVDHILWECKETEQRMNMDMRKEQWINGKKGMEKIIDYAKEIGLYNGI